jgi:hypothetical protein
MLKKVALTSAVALALAAPAWAQTSSTTTSPRTSSTTTATTSTQIDAHKLIGQSIQNEADRKTVGKIDSVILDPSGKVQKVVVGVGGFLGVGKKDVAIDWNQIHVADNGRKVTMNANKDQLKAMPEYQWPKEHPRGSVWTASDTDRRTGATSSGSAGMSSTAPGTGTSRAPDSSSSSSGSSTRSGSSSSTGTSGSSTR